jgi:hypothetical protein
MLLVHAHLTIIHQIFVSTPQNRKYNKYLFFYSTFLKSSSLYVRII